MLIATAVVGPDCVVEVLVWLEGLPVDLLRFRIVPEGVFVAVERKAVNMDASAVFTSVKIEVYGSTVFPQVPLIEQ
jgi:hypothetical protein